MQKKRRLEAKLKATYTMAQKHKTVDRQKVSEFFRAEVNKVKWAIVITNLSIWYDKKKDRRIN